MPENMSRKITIGKFLCSIIIVFHHASAWAYYSYSGITRLFVGFYHDGIFIFAMGYFFFWSGYFCMKQFNKYGYTKEFAKRKWQTLCRPYLLWCGIWSFIIWILSFNQGWTEWVGPGSFTFDHSIMGIIKALFLHAYDGPLWYLVQLIILTVFTPLVAAIVKNKAICLGIIILSAVVYIGGVTLTDFSLAGFIFYIIGAWIAVEGKEQLLSYESKLLNWTALIILLMLIGIVSAFHNYKQIPLAVNLAIQILSVICYWEALNFIKYIKISWFMNLDFFIYVVHNNIEYCLNKYLARIFPSQSVPYLYINVLISFMIVMGFIWTAAKILQNKAPRVYCVLTGDRGNSRMMNGRNYTKPKTES